MNLFSQKKNMQQRTPSRSVSPKNVVIFDYLNNINHSISQYMGVCLYTSKLKNQNVNSLSRQALIETFTVVVKKNGGELFSLPNDNTLILFKKSALDEIKSALVKMTFLFYDDPIMKDFVDIETFSFVQLFDLPNDMDGFKRMILSSMQSQNKIEKKQVIDGTKNTIMVSSPPKNIKKLRRNLSPEILATLQKSLSMTDFSSLIRRQSVCAIIGTSTPQVLFDEVFVAIPDLRDSLLPDVDLMANPWLFQALTETLDKGVLANLLRREDSFLTSSFSLNLNVETILSDAFLKFDASISPQMRATIVLELQLMDVVSDVRAYNLAKTFAQSRGYKICIDGINAEKINYINKAAFEADFIKIIWSQEIKDVFEKDQSFLMHENKAQRVKIILCRVDDEDAIKIGNALGINLYQGHYIQKLLSQQPKKVYYELRK